jgi:hypothetical protein
MLLDTRNKSIYGVGVGISILFEIFGHFLFKRDRRNPYGHDLHTVRCYFIPKQKQNKNIYGLRVGISMVFDIIGHFLFKRE